ncbi:hypothetical protein OSCT_0577 [Oscillochloris trichoides DG-6]|uniref:Gasdermin bGSDM n=1 Tax=Oscillochloris trichoides DG-6 TaxID=765420 RepID=E1IB76_9CHLR|nr:hypothetical protein [Oscillochloris trichoides]EFO81561.1 hypothetical protein OSCT_0577 [Oscillochloris trichoides DG-6]
MQQLTLCRTDPIVALIYERFSANMVRVPDSRIRPLSIIAARRGRNAWRGSLLPLLSNPRAFGIRPEVSQLTDVSGKRSRRVTLDLGMHILRGFLKGFGLPSADLTSTLGRSTYLSFAFPSVRRAAYDLGALGWALAGQQIDRGNPAATIFFGDERHDLLLIDSVLISDQISVTFFNERGQQSDLDVSALTKIFAGAEAHSKGEGQAELILKSEKELTFAFTCVRLFLDQEGRITAMPPDHLLRTLGIPDEPPPQVRYSPDRVLLHAQPGLVMLDS